MKSSSNAGIASTIALYDTSTGSPNLGDQIIMEAVNREVENLFPYAYVYRIPTHDRLGKYGRRILRKSDLVIAGGTNLLFSYWTKMRQWRLREADLLAARRKCVLMGTGWSKYLQPPSLPARLAYRQLLSPTAVHSVRDNYSAGHLARAGFSNVLNTGCPTLWQLTPALLATVPVRKAGSVVTTLTDYSKAPEADRRMLESLKAAYGRVLFWPQGVGDLAYLRELDIGGVEPLHVSLAHFDAVLAGTADIDFVGTRLHAGIRALQHGRRSLIVSIDNRAREMGADFNLPVVERDSLGELPARIEMDQTPSISLPWEAIDDWRMQFKRSASIDGVEP